MHCAHLTDRPDRCSDSKTQIPEPSEAIRSLAFMANLAAQEATGTIDASRSPQQLLMELLAPHPDHSTFVLALLAEDAPTSEPGPLGLPTLPLSDDETYRDILGWAILTVPVHDNPHLIEAEIVVDVEYQPLPEEPLSAAAQQVWTALITEISRVAQLLHRNHLVLWQQSALSDSPATHSLGQLLVSHGFHEAHEELSVAFHADELAHQHHSCEIFVDANFPDDLATKVADIYHLASLDIPHGELPCGPEQWSRERLAAATSHMRQVGTKNIHAIATDDAGTVTGLAEAYLPAGNTDIVDIGLLYVRPERRGAGLGAELAGALAYAIQTHLVAVQRGYASIATSNGAARAVAQKSGAREVSRNTAWLKILG
ncbi:GNAT family N-acetyltransferase [Staphylococcus chromogenes]|nr:GNAT family N-acetyltransferase [Staphylococcus chromogenes]